MIDRGAATHVCPPWFAPKTTLQELQQDEGPRLRAANDDSIRVHGYQWVYLTNTSNQQMVMPSYVCDVSQPILSTRRLTEQGFAVDFNDNPDIAHSKGFKAAPEQHDGLFYSRLCVSLAKQCVPTSVAHLHSETGATAHASNLAWQRHSLRRNHPGVANKVIRAGTIWRYPVPEKVINNSGLTKFARGGSSLTQLPMVYKLLKRDAATASAPTTTKATPLQQTQAAQPQLPPRALPDSPNGNSSDKVSQQTGATITNNKTNSSRWVAEGSLPKQRTTEQPRGLARPETIAEPPKTKLRTKVLAETQQGNLIIAYLREDVTEDQKERILLERIVNNTEGLDEQKTIDNEEGK